MSRTNSGASDRSDSPSPPPGAPGSWRSGLRLRTDSPGKFISQKLSKKFSKTSRFVVSSKVWLQTIPTRDCDIIMTFPSKTSDHVLMWVLARLRSRAPELVVHVRHHSNTGVYGFYLTSSYEHLLKGAEELSIRKPMKQEFGGGMKEFLFEDQDYFEGVDKHDEFLTSQERQSIVQHMLNNLRAVEGDSLCKIKFLEGQAIVPLLMSKGVIKQVLPLHNTENLVDLRKNWVQAFFTAQPLDKVCEYFGVKIAMYFAYLGHYTQALIFPTIIGVLLWLITRYSANKPHGQTTDDICFVAFAFINVIWSSLYLEHWKRRSSEQAFRWGTLDKEDELLVEPRALFTGHLERSAVTGRLEPQASAWKRALFRYFISIPVILLCLSIVFAVMWWIFQIEDWVRSKIHDGDFPFFFKFLPKVLLALCITIMDDIYKRIAEWLNDCENYRLQETYETNLAIKLVLFQFVNSFLSLFYIAFYLQDMERLRFQLAALMITRQVVGNIKEALVPFFVYKIRLFKMGYDMTGAMSPNTLDRQMKEMVGETEETQDDSVSTSHHADDNGDDPDTPPLVTPPETPTAEMAGNGGEHNGCEDLREETPEEEGGELDINHSGPALTQAEVEAAMKKYEDTFEDYLEMFIQFGYVTLFSSAFPMAALCALLNNVIEIRSDAFKLCMTFQRPFGQRVENAGVWQDVLEIMSVIAVMVNCALIGMSGLSQRLFPDLTTAERMVYIILLEHVILALKFIIAYAIPDIPQWVAEEKARLEFFRREALKKLESKINTPKIGSQEHPTSPNSQVTSPTYPKKFSAPTSPVSPSNNDKSPVITRRRGAVIDASKFNNIDDTCSSPSSTCTSQKTDSNAETGKDVKAE